MKPEELLSKELSVWKEKPAKAVSNIIFPYVLKYKLRTSLPAFTTHYTLMHHFLLNKILITLSFNTLFPYRIPNDSKVQSKINIWSFYQHFCFFQVESRSKSHEIKKVAVKREHVPAVNMEDSPPVSDSDVSTGAVLQHEDVEWEQWQLRLQIWADGFTELWGYHLPTGCAVSIQV